MSWEVEYTDESEQWWLGLKESEQEDTDAYVTLLEIHGTTLRYAYSSGIGSSRHSHMRELRVQSSGQPIRILYAFDPRRNAILLLGGDKTGNNRWYQEFVPTADELYDQHLEQLRKEGLIDG